MLQVSWIESNYSKHYQRWLYRVHAWANRYGTRVIQVYHGDDYALAEAYRNQAIIKWESLFGKGGKDVD